jgi:hypothetical protein
VGREGDALPRPDRGCLLPLGYRSGTRGAAIHTGCGFNIYCTVDSVVYNELNYKKRLMSRVEMTVFHDVL